MYLLKKIIIIYPVIHLEKTYRTQRHKRKFESTYKIYSLIRHVPSTKHLKISLLTPNITLTYKLIQIQFKKCHRYAFETYPTKFFLEEQVYEKIKTFLKYT